MKYWKILIILGLILIFFGTYLIIGPKAFNQQRSNVIFSLDKAIKQAKESGDYKCCIEPACKMCYLGNWIFEDGKCNCDGLIAEGRLDEVCPECGHELEGECESENDYCPVEI